MKHSRARLFPRLLAATAAGAVVFLPASPALAAPGSTGVVAQAMLTEAVTDEAGILSADEVAEIEDAARRLQDEEQLTLRVIFANDFGSQSPQEFTGAAVEASGGGNVGVFAVAVDTSQYGFYGGEAWSDQQLDNFDSGALTALQNGDFAGAPVAGVDEVTGSAAGEGGDGSGAGWLIAGGAGVVAVGGGAWWLTRRNKSKQLGDALKQSRELDPADTRAIAALPLSALEERAEEVIVATDESVRNAQEELKIASGEFGPERTRPFLRAVNQANSALQRAYQIRAQLNDSIPESEQEKRALYTEVISSCGQADQALDEQSDKFRELRNLLINASSKLDELTQKTVDLRARLEPATATLESLCAEYPAEVLDSINDNDEMARVALDEGEKALSQARHLQQRPAGQQGGLIDAIRESERAVNLADDLLGGIEHAETNIATAKNGLPDLIAEVEDEIGEAGELKKAGRSAGSQVDWEALEKAVDQARTELEYARTEGSTDPLSAYQQLMSADSELDDALDSARQGHQDQKRKLAVVDQQLATVASQIEGAEDLISSRGRVVGSEARTHLAEAKRMFAQAQHLRTKDTHAANRFARGAGVAAQKSVSSVRADLQRYQQQHRRDNGNGTGSMIAGMVIGSLLSGGGRGGFGGGFGGGGGGGGGGGFRGGGF